MFEQQLALKIIPSWAPFYVNYSDLKHAIHAVQKDKGAAWSCTSFCTKFLDEATKVNDRFKEQAADARQKLAALETSEPLDASRPGKSAAWKADFELLKSQLETLQDFAQTNVLACRRILEEADAFVDGESLVQNLWPSVAALEFASVSHEDNLLHKARAVWRNYTAVPVPQPTLVDDPAGPSKIEPKVPTVTHLDLDSFPVGKVSRVWIALAEDGMGLPVRVPVMVAKGALKGPVVGITAALHGNELNGIPLIHQLFKGLDPQALHGTIVAVPVSNSPGYLLSQRGYSDGTDLNRVMPGKADGTAPQVYAYNLLNRIVCHFNYLIDLHTASAGRINSLYVRANLCDPRTARMARLQNPQIIVHNTSPGGSLRGAAMNIGIPAITVEIGNPSTFDSVYVKNALVGVTNILTQMTMVPDEERPTDYEPIVCSRSYWIFAKSGGILTVHPQLATWVRAGDLIATIHNVFGDVEEEYYAPQDGVIVGKHVDPVCQTGGRILHLGVVEGELQAVVDDGHM
ncbi:hypothetical protein GGI07_004093 [Coemansia sp. Benny D115]|nr:hypothetical protein GGI07_004093 [Coemansia sp. Benny D115]